MDEPTTFLFSGYARLPQDVSHQAMYKRVGVVFEVDDKGVVLGASTTLMMEVASGFFERLLLGRNVLTERAEIEATVRYRYRGHSQGALDLGAPQGVRGRGPEPARPGRGRGAPAERAAGRHRQRARLIPGGRAALAAARPAEQVPPEEGEAPPLDPPTLVPGGARARQRGAVRAGGGR